MAETSKPIDALFLGLYAWMVTIFFGMVLIDIVYSNRVPEAGGVIAGVADLLLVAAFVSVMIGAAALAISWRSKAARILLAASLCLLALEFLIPVGLGLFVQNSRQILSGLWIEALLNGAASVFAFLGTDQYYRLERKAEVL